MNIYDYDLPSLGEETDFPLLDGENARIVRTVSNRASSPKDFWYDQSEDEWVLVLEGSCELRFEDGTKKLSKGEWVFIPAGKRHRVERTSSDPPCVFLCVFIKN